MSTQTPTMFGALRALLFSIGLFYFGLWLSLSHDQIIVWMGVFFSVVACIAMVKSFVLIAKSGISVSRQYRYSYHAHTSSGILGDAKLADQNSPILKKLASIKHGLFFGAYLNSLLFIDLFEQNHAHWMIYGPARSGKTSCILIPTALNWSGGSLFIPSIKKATLCICEAAWRRNKLRVLIWDPFALLGKECKRFNPLRILVEDVQKNGGKNLQALAILIATTIIPKAKKDENPFFNNGAIKFLTGLMIFLAVFRPWQCHLPGLNDLVWASQEEKKKVVSLMKVGKKNGNLVKKYGNHFEELFNPVYLKTFGPMRDIAVEATLIYDADTEFGRSLMGHDFALEDILDGNTVFCPVISEGKLTTHGQAIGLMAAIIFELVAALENPTKLLMLLDEAGNFGHIPNLSNKAMTLLPEKGLRVVLAYQSRNQAFDVNGENETRNMEKQCTGIQEWGINDENDAKQLSSRTGVKTIKVVNMQYNPADPVQPWKPSISETQRAVKDSFEIQTSSPKKSFIAMKSQPVIWADLVPYYQVQEWRDIASPHPSHPEGYPKDEPVRFTLRQNDGK